MRTIEDRPEARQFSLRGHGFSLERGALVLL